ncbi:MAG: hypothetical protein KDC54_11620, partial [Lewinella sp.]|nr:hypothetical protein [Lewinella sp.]
MKTMPEARDGKISVSAVLAVSAASMGCKTGAMIDDRTKMKQKIKWLLVGVIALWGATIVYSCVTGLRLAKVTAEVVDEGGNPVEDAETWFTFDKDIVRKEFTGKDGRASGEAMAPPYCLSIAAWKDGYYSGRIGSTFHFEETDGTRWLPW